MDSIKFKAAFGDQEKEVELTAPTGAGGGYQIFIDRYYFGSIILVNDQWTTMLNPKGEKELTTEDRMILIDMITGLT